MQDEGFASYVALDVDSCALLAEARKRRERRVYGRTSDVEETIFGAEEELCVDTMLNVVLCRRDQ